MASKQQIIDKINNFENEIDQFLNVVKQKRDHKLKKIKRFDRQLLIGWIISIITSLIFSTLIILLFVFDVFKIFHK